MKTMEDDVVLAKRHNNVVMVTYHIHDLSHDRSHGYPDVTPPNDSIIYRRAVEAAPTSSSAPARTSCAALRSTRANPSSTVWAISFTSTARQRKSPSIHPPARPRGGAANERIRL